MILNLTQHPATETQKQAGVVDLRGDELATLKELLTFNAPPSQTEMEARAHDVAKLVMFNGLGEGDDDPVFLSAMIGGAPFFMSTLERELKADHITPVYAFSERVTEEYTDEAGAVHKKNVFRHAGFVSAV